MIDIVHNQVLKLNNVMTYREEISSDEMNLVISDMRDYIDSIHAITKGYVTTITHNVKVMNQIQIIDYEVLMQLDQRYQLNEKYKFLDEYIIENAIMFRHRGNVGTMQAEINEFIEYVKDNSLRISSNLHIQIVEELTPNQEAIYDFYIGIKNN